MELNRCKECDQWWCSHANPGRFFFIGNICPDCIGRKPEMGYPPLTSQRAIGKSREAVEHRREIVLTMTKQGCTAAEIAAILKVTERTVQRLRVKAGCAQPRSPLLTEEQLAYAQRLLEDGCSYEETARTTGCSSTSLADHFPGYGWTKVQCGQYGRLLRRERMMR